MRRFAAHYALLPSGIVANPLITAGDDLRIADIATFDPQRLDSYAGVEFYAGIIVPAFVNAHTHLELACMEGAIPQGCGYAGFAAAMAKKRGAFTDAQRLDAIREADRRMFEEGVGTAGDIANGGTTFGHKEHSRISYRTFVEVFGLLRNNLEQARMLVRERGSDAYSLTPHSLYSLNDDVLRPLCYEGDGVLSIHFMESPAEQQLFEGRGALCDWFAAEGFRPDFLHYGSPAERLTACAPPDRSVMLVHCTTVTQRDIDTIMSHFTAPVYWCLCPRSNRYISGLAPDVALLRRNGLNICIGTDSPASNTSLSMVAEMAALPELGIEEALRAATAGGAEALGAGDGAGRLEKGSRCGLAIIEGIDFGRGIFTKKASARRLM